MCSKNRKAHSVSGEEEAGDRWEREQNCWNALNVSNTGGKHFRAGSKFETVS